MTKATQAERGSAKLLMERCDTRTFDDSDLKRLIAALDMDGIEIVDYFPQGIPAPHVLQGRLRVSSHALHSLIEQINSSESVYWKMLEAFPNGIPFPDVWQVAFEVVPGY